MKHNRPAMKITENPLAGGSYTNWRRLRMDNDPVERQYIWRAVYITFMTLLFAPVRGLQNRLFGRQIANTTLDKDPIFVLGHYRSGGTYLMNVLTCDSQWGFLSTTQALLPEMFLLGRPIRNMFNLFLHEKRPMDNIRVSPESPEEPEHAIGNLIPYGFYQGFCFPKRMMEYVHHSVLLEGDEAIRHEWERAYQFILKACTLANGGRQLLIKNPPDTARIPALLARYPNAKFIFLYRNPYVMFPSIRNFYSVYIRDWQLQSIPKDTLEENILTIYAQIMDRYQRDKHLIPDHNLVEVKFEDFEAQPLEEIQRIYSTLNLSGFVAARPAFERYIDSQKDYVKNNYILTQAEVDRITQHWSADIQRWHYTPEAGVAVLKE